MTLPAASVGLAIVATAMGVLTRSPQAQARSLAFLDRYIEAVPWPLLLAGIPVLGMALLAALRYPLAIVAAAAALLPLNLVGRGGEGSALALSKVVVNVLFLLSLVAVLTTSDAARRWLRTTKVGWWLSALCGCLAFSGIQGYVAGYDLHEWLRELGWLAFYAFAIPVGCFVDTRRDLRLIVAVLVLGALVQQASALNFLVSASRFERPEDWFGGETYLRVPWSEGMRFVYLWSLAALFQLWADWRLSRWGAVGLMLLAILLTIGLLASLARSLWFTTALGVILVLILVSHNRRTGFLLVGGAIGGGVALIGIQILDRLSPYSSGDWLGQATLFVRALWDADGQSSIVGRQVEWRNAIALWLQSPFVGNGIGAGFEPTIYSRPDLAAFFTHNSYLNLLAKLGVVGAVAFVGLLTAVARLLRGVMRASGATPADRALAVALTAYLAAVMVHSVAAATITTTDTVMLFALLLGVAVALGRIVGVGPWARPDATASQVDLTQGDGPPS